jgi:hypothetical protein
MHYMNSGEITGFKEEELDTVIELLVAAGLYDRKERVPVYEAKGNVPLTIGIEEVYGDISFNLQNFVDFCKEKGIAIDGSISYCGDSDGGYEIKESMLQELAEDELAIRDASDKQLLDELQRRGYLKIQIKLEEFFSTVGESENIVVCDEDGRELARYDGKQSIPVELNQKTVFKIKRETGVVTVFIAHKVPILDENGKNDLKEIMRELLETRGYAVTDEKINELFDVYEDCQEWEDDQMLSGNTYDEVEDFVKHSSCVDEILK